MMNVNPKKRLRTEAQLARKRHADKVNHKAKRDRTKSQMDKLEAEMVQLRQRIKEMSEQLHVLHADVLRHHNACTPPTVREQLSPAPSLPLSPDTYSGQAFHGHILPSQMNNAMEGTIGLDLEFDSEGMSTGPFASQCPPPTTPAAATASFMPSTPPSLSPSSSSSSSSSTIFGRLPNNDPRFGPLLDIVSEYHNRILVECRCGIDHKLPSECLEYSTFLIILRAHESLSRSIHNPPPPLPRNPSMLSLFRHSCSNNPIVHILGSIFNQIHPVNVYTLFAIYLSMYRYLRWRLHPGSESFNDMPPWIYASEIQKSIPHPVCIDFLPWPGLRDYLTTHQNQDIRHSVSLYVRSIRFRWPEDKPFYTTTARGEILLNAEFEAEMFKYENWMLSREWAAMFPHLTQYVNIEAPSTSTSTSRSPSQDLSAGAPTEGVIGKSS